jgi:hypothetical protein
MKIPRLAPGLTLCALTAVLGGCGHLQPPQPLGKGEIYVCQPFSAIRDRAPASTVLYHARIAPRHGTCS